MSSPTVVGTGSSSKWKLTLSRALTETEINGFPGTSSWRLSGCLCGNNVIDSDFESTSWKLTFNRNLTQAEINGFPGTGSWALTGDLSGNSVASTSNANTIFNRTNWELTLSRRLTASEVTGFPGTGLWALTGNSVSSASFGTRSNQYNILVNNPVNTSGTYTISFNSNTISDSISGGDLYRAGPAIDFASEVVTYDTRLPVLTVTSFTAPIGTQTGTTSAFTLTLGYSVLATQLTSADFAISLASASFFSITPTSGSNTVYTINITNPTTANGVYTVSLNANSVPDSTTYRAGPASAYTSTSVSYDTRPQIAVTSFTAPSGTQSGTTSTFRLTLDRTVPTTQITGVDFTVSVTTASISSVSPVGTQTNDNRYNVVITNPTNLQGCYTISLNVNAIDAGTDYRAGPASAYTSTSVSYDTRQQIAVSTFTAPSGTQSGTTSTFRLTLNSSVPASELTNSDFTVQTGSNATISLVSPQSGSILNGKSSRYDIAVTNPSNRNGTYTISINGPDSANPPNFAINSDGTNYKKGPSNTVTSCPVTYDTRTNIVVSSLVAQTSSAVSPIRSSTSTFTLNLDRAVLATEVTASDFTTSVGTASIASVAKVGTNTTAIQYEITVNNPNNTQGDFTITINANAVSAGTSYKAGPVSSFTSTTSLYYDTRGYTAIWGTPSYCESNRKLSIPIQFSHNVTGIAVSDFEVINSQNIIQTTGWTFDSPTASVNADTNITISVLVPTNTNADFAIRVKANQIQFAGLGTDNGPVSATSSGFILIDNRPEVSVSSFTVVTGCASTADMRDFTIIFDRSIPATELTSSDFVGTSNARVTTISPTSGSQTTYTITVTQPVNNTGSYAISLNANSISAGTNYRSGPVQNDPNREIDCISYDTRRYTATWGTATYNSILNSFSANITFSHPVTNPSATAFQLLNQDGSVPNPSWGTLTIRTATISGVQTTTVIATPPLNVTNGSFKLKVLADQIRFAGSTTPNGPDDSSETNVVEIDNRPDSLPIISASISDQTVIRGTNRVINLNDHFSGSPNPTYSITSIDRSWIQLNGNTLTISPNDNELRSAPYPVSIEATNSEGTIQDSFDVLVVQASPYYKRVPDTCRDDNIHFDEVLNPLGPQLTAAGGHVYFPFSSENIQITLGTPISYLAPNSITNTGLSLAKTRIRIRLSIATTNLVITDFTLSSLGLPTSAPSVNIIQIERIGRSGNFLWDLTLSRKLTCEEFCRLANAEQWTVSGNTVTSYRNIPATIIFTQKIGTGNSATWVLSFNRSLTTEEYNSLTGQWAISGNDVVNEGPQFSYNSIMRRDLDLGNLQYIFNFDTSLVNTITRHTSSVEEGKTYLYIIPTNPRRVEKYEVPNLIGTQRFGINESAPKAIAYHNNKMYFIGEDTEYLCTLNIDTGKATRIGNETNYGISTLKIFDLTSDGTNLYGIGATTSPIEEALYTLDITTGRAAKVGTALRLGLISPFQTNPVGLAWKPDIGSDPEILYMVGNNPKTLYSINKTTGIASSIGTLTGFNTGTNIRTLDYINNILYLLGSTTSSGSIYSICTGNGSLTEIGGSNFGTDANESDPKGIGHITINEQSTTYLIASDSSGTSNLYHINLSTGIATPRPFFPILNPSQIRVSGGYFVPEGNDYAQVNNRHTAIAYNDNNQKLYLFGKLLGLESTTRIFQYRIYSRDGVKQGDYSLPANVRAHNGVTRIEYDSESNYFYALNDEGNLAAYKVGTDDRLTYNPNIVFNFCNNNFILGNLTYDENRLFIRNRKAPSSISKFVRTIPSLEPQVSIPIPDQSIIRGTVTEINLSAHFIGHPEPTHEIITTSTGTWVTIHGNTLRMEPPRDLETCTYPVTIRAYNNAGEINDDFNISVSAALATASWEVIRGSRTISGDLRFNGASISGVEPGDFDIINANNEIQNSKTPGSTKWTISARQIEGSSTSSASLYEIKVEPPDISPPGIPIKGNFKLRLNTNTITSDGVSNNFPTASLDSELVYLNPEHTRVDENNVEISWSGITGGTTLSGTITFQGSVIRNINSNDFEIHNATAAQAGWTIEVTNLVIEGGSRFRVIGTPPINSNNQFKFRLKALSVRSDGYAYRNVPSAEKDSNFADINNTIISIQEEQWSNIIGGTTLSGTLTFNRPTRGIEISDFSIRMTNGDPTTGWTISSVNKSLVGAGESVKIVATPDSTISTGTFKIRLIRNSVQTGSSSTNNAPSTDLDSSAVYINRTPSITITWNDATGGLTLSANLSSDIHLVGIEQTDFIVLDGNDVDQNWNISISSTSLDRGESLSVIANPPNRIEGSFKLRLKRNSVKSIDNVSLPSDNIDFASTLQVNNKIPRADVEWNSIKGGEFLEGQLAFSRTSVTNLETSDFKVLDNTDTDVTGTGWTVASTLPSSSIQPRTPVIIKMTPPSGSTTNGEFKLELNAQSIRSKGFTSDDIPLENLQSESVYIDERNSIGTDPSWQGELSYSNKKIEGTLNFPEGNFFGIEASNFVILDSTNTPFAGQEPWLISVSANTLSGGGNLIVTASPPENIFGDFKIRLKSAEIRVGTNDSNNYPSANIDHPTAISIDNRPRLKVLSFTGPSELQKSLLTIFKLTFNFPVPATELDIPTDFITTSGISGVSVNAKYPTSGNSKEYDIIVINPISPNPQTGEYNLTLKNTAVSDAETYQGDLGNNIVSTTVKYDSTGNLASWRLPTYCFGTSILSAQIRFSHNVTGIVRTEGVDFEIIDDGGIIQTGWAFTAPSSATANTEITISATVPSNAYGNFAIRVKGKSISYGTLNGPDLSVSTRSILVDNRRPNLVWSDLTGGTALSTQLTFGSVNIEDIESEDFVVVEVLNPTIKFDLDINLSTLPLGTGTDQLAITTLPLGVTAPNAPTKIASTGAIGSSGSTSTWRLPILKSGNVTVTELIAITLDVSGRVISNKVNTPSNLEQGNWTINISSNSVSENGFLIVTAVPPINTNGDFKIRLKPSQVPFGSGFLSQSETGVEAIDNRTPQPVRVISFTGPSKEQTEDQVSLTLVFDRNVPRSQLAPCDFILTNGAQLISTNPIKPTTTYNRNTYQITVDQPSGQGTYTVTFKANGVEAGTNYQKGPEANFVSNEISYNRYDRIVTWETPTYTKGRLTGKIQFNQNITGIESTDFEIIDRNGALQTVGSIGIQLSNRISSLAISNICIAGLPSGISLSNTIAIGSEPTNRWGLKFTKNRTRVRLSTKVRNLEIDNSGDGRITITGLPTAPDQVTLTNVTPIGTEPTDYWELEFEANSASRILTDSERSVLDITITGYDPEPMAWIDNALTEDEKDNLNITITGYDPNPTVSNIYNGWIFDVPTTENPLTSRSNINTINCGTDITIAAIPPENTYGNFGIRIKTGSVQVAGSSPIKNEPETAISSDFILVDNRSELTADLELGSSPDLTRKEIPATLQLNHRIPVSQITKSIFTISSSQASIKSITPRDRNDQGASRYGLIINNPIVISATPSYNIDLPVGSIKGSSTYKPGPAIRERLIITPGISTEDIAEWTEVTGGTTLSGKLTFRNQNTSGIETTDFGVLDHTNTLVSSGWDINCLPSEIDFGKSLQVIATPSNSVDNCFKLRLKSMQIIWGTCSNDNAPCSPIDSPEFVSVNNSNTIIWSSISSSNNTLIGTITFGSIDITCLEPLDFEVIDDSTPAVVRNGWTFTINQNTTNSTIVSGNRIITATAPSNIKGNFRLRLKPTSIRTLDSSNDNLPIERVESALVAFDNRVIEITWTEVSGGIELTAILNFRNNDSITPANRNSIEVLTNCNGDTTNWNPDPIQLPNTITPNQSIIITATPPTNTVGNFIFKLSSGSIILGQSPCGDLKTPSKFINNITLTWTSITGDIVLRATLASSTSVYEFDGSEFEILSKDNRIIDGWSIDPETDNFSTDMSVIATPPNNINGSFKIRLKALSASSSLGGCDNTPVNIVDSGLASVQSIEIGWTNLSQSGQNLGARLNLSTHIGDLEIFNLLPTDLKILNNNNISQSGWILGSSWILTSGTTLQIDGFGNFDEYLEFYAPIGIDDYYKIRLEKLSLKVLGNQKGSLPRTNIDTELVLIQTIAITWDNNNINWDRSGNQLSGDLIFSSIITGRINISGIEARDFEILDQNDSIQDNWPDPTYPGFGHLWAFDSAAVLQDRTITIRFTPPVDTDGRYKIRLKAKSLTAKGNIPRIDIDSILISVDNTGP